GSGMFQALDANGDGLLSLREMRGAWKRLEKLDVNKDGFITRDEFPTQFQLTVNQGANNFGLIAPPTMQGQQPQPRGRVRGPVWRGGGGGRVGRGSPPAAPMPRRPAPDGGGATRGPPGLGAPDEGCRPRCPAPATRTAPAPAG